MNSKKYTKTTLIIALALLLIIGGLSFLVDPLFQFHKPWFGMEPVITDERYQYGGIAKNFDFDNVIMGNSLCENFRASDFDKYYDNTFKLTISGSTPYDWDILLKLLDERDNKVKHVVSNIDVHTLRIPPDGSDIDLPEFLYEDCSVKDVEYLLNYQLFLKFTADTLKRNITGDVPEIDSLFLKEFRGKETVLSNYSRNDIAAEYPDKDKKLEIINRNLDILIPRINMMPDTEFDFFISPVSILYWDGIVRGKDELWWREGNYVICERLLECENVRLYLWTDAKMLEIMSDLDNYFDPVHYSTSICTLLADRIGNGVGIVTKENYKDKIDALFDYTLTYDFDSFFTD